MPAVTLYPSHDTFVTEPNPNFNYSAYTLLAVGNDWTYGKARAWLQFDLSSVPVGSTINSATLTLQSFFANNSWTYPPTLFFNLARCTDNTWTESGITWNNAPNGSCGSVIGSEDFFINYASPVPFAGLASEISAALGARKVSFRVKLDDESNPGFGEWFADYDYPSSFSTLAIDYTPPPAKFLQLLGVG